MNLNEASIVSGPLHSEIMSAAKSGGGRIQLELTPPEQGTIRIDLRIDQSGRAHLIVEGASDAAKARLDQGGQQLKNEFAQMGLNLSLDLRQGDSRFAQNQQFGSDQARFAQPSSSTDRSSMGIGLLSERLASSRFLSDNASGVSGIHLYA
jgi:flagellar hook-length control protein FliK